MKRSITTVGSIIGAIFVLSACMSPIVDRKLVPMTKAQIQEVERAVANSLKDPRSAQFREIRMIEGTDRNGKVSTLVCGQVNRKNASGGYIGFATFNGVFKRNVFKLNGIGGLNDSWLYDLSCKV